MRHVLIINGSPHKNGATAQLTAAFIDGLGAAAITRFDCFDHTVRPCDDCRFCRTANGCRHRDLDDFYTSLEAADLLIFASPVYNRSFPAPMKAVLDRLQRYWSARFCRNQRPPIAKPKTAVLLTVGGSGRQDGEHLYAQLSPILTILNCTPAIAVHADDTDCAALSPALLQAAKEAGQKA